MNRVPISPPAIPVLSAVYKRPLWSVMIPVYNCNQFLKETLESVLCQLLPEGEMEIEVVDDASTDTDVEVLVKQVGKGRIKYYRQKENVGSLKNFETCIVRSKGELIHILHGDDLVRPGFYDKLGSLFNKYPEAGAAFCRYNCIDENGKSLYTKSPESKHDGILENWLFTIAERQHIQYAAIAVKREVYEKLGSFYGVNYGEDWEMWVRIAKHYPMAYTPAILADYRKHVNSISSNKYLTGQYLKDISFVTELIQNHLPSESKESILKKSRKYYASYGIKMAGNTWTALKDKQAVDAQIKHALTLYKGPWTYWLTAKLYFKLALSKLWHSVSQL
ncbi:glycosyltransferase family 2 protein [Pontibacter ramchanderi]|uniref:GT2 family glycosyltransferase n=1 Tax=Pontibacter ramchanderi TaxID=1179743 RepID=A0A2N3U7R5_9BACT|nr:glycosyltransferase [Pontibacter ramchanderi]PKV62786.1 GT2 family glycosyltransferase [Pontibacter ramchanderi]